jgi:DEAD/DEAH box helicase domain-containing protein
MKEIQKSLGRRMKLDTIAEGTLGMNKSGHGLQAVTWWKQGEIEKIRQYCLDDVKVTKKIYDYALKNGKVKYKDMGKTISIPLDTSDWETPTENSLTHTLPF